MFSLFYAVPCVILVNKIMKLIALQYSVKIHLLFKKCINFYYENLIKTIQNNKVQKIHLLFKEYRKCCYENSIKTIEKRINVTIMLNDKTELKEF